jgi:hypothetical protein
MLYKIVNAGKCDKGQPCPRLKRKIRLNKMTQNSYYECCFDNGNIYSIECDIIINSNKIIFSKKCEGYCSVNTKYYCQEDYHLYDNRDFALIFLVFSVILIILMIMVIYGI